MMIINQKIEIACPKCRRRAGYGGYSGGLRYAYPYKAYVQIFCQACHEGIDCINHEEYARLNRSWGDGRNKEPYHLRCLFGHGVLKRVYR